MAISSYAFDQSLDLMKRLLALHFNAFYVTGFYLNPSKNIRKLDVFWFFQGIHKVTSGMKWVRENNCKENSNLIQAVGK